MKMQIERGPIKTQTAASGQPGGGPPFGGEKIAAASAPPPKDDPRNFWDNKKYKPEELIRMENLIIDGIRKTPPKELAKRLMLFSDQLNAMGDLEKNVFGKNKRVD